ncbi:MAG: hypothetical protein OHK0024_14340 [Thalassobaculales bacterium]
MVDSQRLRTLENAAQRAGVITSIFEVRCESLDDRQFKAFAELMDLYISIAQRTVKAGKDYIDEGFLLTGEDAERLNAVFAKIFRTTPAGFLEACATAQAAADKAAGDAKADRR